MAKLNLSPPWVVYYRKLSAFFKEDPEVKIVYDDIEQEIKLYVSNAEKAVALEFWKCDIIYYNYSCK